MNKGDSARHRMDLVVGGAGFAGLALAIALRQALGETFRIAVVDPASRTPRRRIRAPPRSPPLPGACSKRSRSGMRWRPMRNRSSIWW